MTGREKFEAWLTSLPGFEAADVAKSEDGKYNYIETDWCWRSWQAALASKQSVDDGWVEWKGGELPELAPLLEVRKGDGTTDTGFPESFEWDHIGDLSDIIAYRLVKP